MFTDILAATDLVRVSDNGVVAAAKLAENFHAKLHILHVLESSEARNRRKVRHFVTGEEIITSDAYEKQVADEIHAVYSPIVHSSVDGDIRVVAGFPWEEILRWSRRLKPGLIVMGPHSGRAAEKGVIRVAGKIGSTVEGVVTRENCPVMIINPAVQVKTAGFKRIIVGVDFSVSCECALAFAGQLAEKSDGRLFPFHMIPVPPYPKYSRENYETDLAAAKQRLTDFCGPFLGDLPHEYIVWGGALPHLEILSCAEKNQADLIVMGSHTKETQGKWYSGSVVERTGFRAACPVVVVTDPNALVPWDGDGLPDSAIGREKDRMIHVFTKDRRS
ncbi:MAG: universal stress protein UspA [Desulfobacterales bacterium CG23_combo_of_CG06-09_8_20_14_all_51_8]|nr:MAG: universal stress protein UspA [Desulfobacterales bacterium CG23_combo_of_CG06-09_8_20_14_all_51_8]